MRGYLLYHKSAQDKNGYTSDFYGYDPYVWSVPYLWSFCHMGQHPHVEPGTVILWLTRVQGVPQFCCDLVFIVDKVFSLEEARQSYAPHNDMPLARSHFQRGLNEHGEKAKNNHTYIANMNESYIPHPAVPIQKEVDKELKIAKPRVGPLARSWQEGMFTPMISFEVIDGLVQFVAAHAQHKEQGALSYDEMKTSSGGHHGHHRSK